jgi:hypothetical protein
MPRSPPSRGGMRSADEKSTPRLAPEALARIDECLAAAGRRLEDVERKYRGRDLSAEVQAALRAEHRRVLDARIACTSDANRK